MRVNFFNACYFINALIWQLYFLVILPIYGWLEVVIALTVTVIICQYFCSYFNTLINNNMLEIIYQSSILMTCIWR